MGSPTEATVRDLRADDLAAALAINGANVPEVGAVDLDRLSFLVTESTFSLVVEVDGEVVGFCVVLPLGSPYDSVNYRWFAERYDDVVYLDRVAFDERHQRRGLGGLLYRAVEQRASATGAAAIALEVNLEPANEPSLAFHQRQGFREVGRQDTPYGIVVSMQRKDLDGSSPARPVSDGPA